MFIQSIYSLLENLTPALQGTTELVLELNLQEVLLTTILPSQLLGMMRARVRWVNSMDMGSLSHFFCCEMSSWVRSCVNIMAVHKMSNLISLPPSSWLISLGMVPCWGLSLGLCWWQTVHSAVAVAWSALVSGFPCYGFPAMATWFISPLGNDGDGCG